MIERYGIHWVNMDPVQGGEIAKTRPAVVISDGKMNKYLETVVICPVTSRIHPHWPSRVQFVMDNQSNEVAVDQIRTIDKSRLGERLGVLDETAAAAVRHLITLMYGVLSVED